MSNHVVLGSLRGSKGRFFAGSEMMTMHPGFSVVNNDLVYNAKLDGRFLVSLWCLYHECLRAGAKDGWFSSNVQIDNVEIKSKKGPIIISVRLDGEGRDFHIISPAHLIFHCRSYRFRVNWFDVLVGTGYECAVCNDDMCLMLFGSESDARNSVLSILDKATNTNHRINGCMFVNGSGVLSLNDNAITQLVDE